MIMTPTKRDQAARLSRHRVNEYQLESRSSIVLAHVSRAHPKFADLLRIVAAEKGIDLPFARQPSVQAFIETAAYLKHKEEHFPKADNKNILKNPAFFLNDPKTRALYEKA
jgi:hypothetical protein